MEKDQRGKQLASSDVGRHKFGVSSMNIGILHWHRQSVVYKSIMWAAEVSHRKQNLMSKELILSCNFQCWISVMAYCSLLVSVLVGLTIWPLPRHHLLVTLHETKIRLSRFVQKQPTLYRSPCPCGSVTLFLLYLLRLMLLSSSLNLFCLCH